MKKKLNESRNDGESYLLDESVAQAATIISQGGVVAFPTETYYGLAVDPFNSKAIERLFDLKKRPLLKPVLLLIHDRSLLDSLVSNIPELYIPLMEKYWPGPLTLIFPAKCNLSPFVTGKTATVGVRISPHPLALALGRQTGMAITATSANLAGFPPARLSSEVVGYFGKKIDYILDGGKTPAGFCSTILGMNNSQLILLRPGAVIIPELEHS